MSAEQQKAAVALFGRLSSEPMQDKSLDDLYKLSSEVVSHCADPASIFPFYLTVISDEINRKHRVHILEVELVEARAQFKEASQQRDLQERNRDRQFKNSFRISCLLAVFAAIAALGSVLLWWNPHEPAHRDTSDTPSNPRASTTANKQIPPASKSTESQAMAATPAMNVSTNQTPGKTTSPDSAQKTPP